MSQLATNEKVKLSKQHYLENSIKTILFGKGFELLQGEYVDRHSQFFFRDTEGYYYSLSATRIKEGRIPGKFNLSNPYTMQNIKLFCTDRSFEVLSDAYHGHEFKYELKCKNEGCREIFYLSWDSIQQGINCPYCAGKKVGTSNCLAVRNKELIEEWHPTLNGKLTPYDVTTGSTRKVWWKCRNENHKPWKASISSRVDSRGCPYCSGRMATNENNLLVLHSELIAEWCYDKNKKMPEDFAPKSGKKVWWKCILCSERWEAKIIKRTKEGHNCPYCSASKGEKRIREFLKINNINYNEQKEFDGLIGIGGGNLSYDFYLTDYDQLVEYQGEFHDGNGNDYIKKNLKRQQEHDKRKIEYAQKSGIELLEIWYWDFENIEEILSSKLKIE